MNMTRLCLIVLVAMCVVYSCDAWGVRVRARIHIGIGKKRSAGQLVKNGQLVSIDLQLNQCDFTSYDLKDHNGKITLEEMKDTFERHGKAKTDPENEEIYAIVHHIFYLLDQNGNEEITKEEFNAVAPNLIKGC